MHLGSSRVDSPVGPRFAFVQVLIQPQTHPARGRWLIFVASGIEQMAAGFHEIHEAD